MKARKVYAPRKGRSPVRTIRADLAEAVYATRVRLGITQAEMARTVGFEARTIREIELGERFPTPMLLLKLTAMAAGKERATLLDYCAADFGEGGRFVRDLFRDLPEVKRPAA